MKKVKSRLSNKKNSKSKKKGGAWFQSLAQRGLDSTKRLAQRGLEWVDFLKVLDSTKRLKMRILGMNLLKQMGINPQSLVDCGCLGDNDCIGKENVCDQYRNKCVKPYESDQDKTTRRINEIEKLDISYFGKKTASDFITNIQEEIVNKFPSTSMNLPELKTFIISHIISQRRKNEMKDINEPSLAEFISIFYGPVSEIKGDILNKYSVFQIINSNPEIRNNLNRAIKIPDGISKKDWLGLSDPSKKDKSRNLISRKCLAESFTSGEKYPLGILLPCILLTTKWSSILDFWIIKKLNIINEHNRNLLLELERGVDSPGTIENLKNLIDSLPQERKNFDPQEGGFGDVDDDDEEGAILKTVAEVVILILVILLICL